MTIDNVALAIALGPLVAEGAGVVTGAAVARAVGCCETTAGVALPPLPPPHAAKVDAAMSADTAEMK
jgi:hypothetical protein